MLNVCPGVKFSPEQADSWITSSTIAMLIDVAIQQPGVIFVKAYFIGCFGGALSSVVTKILAPLGID